jgi:TonB-linked SusC/RagA family outer membrane protein
LPLKFLACAFALALLAAAPAAAQTGTVAGTVTSDATGELLPGVNVLVEGSDRGAATGAGGTYEIAGVEAGTYTVRASFIGYGDEVQEGIEVNAGETTTVDFAMQQAATELDSVVVVGYSEQQREDLTGAITTVSAEEIEAQPLTNTSAALQARAPGVRITRGGAPNGDAKIRIRGANSLRGNNDPLVVIDGFVGGNISSVQPDNIASINVLKGPSATAIYGIRGANGVVIIETKQGKRGEPRITFDSFVSTSAVTEKFNMLGPMEYANLVNQKDAALGSKPTFSDAELAEIRQNGGTDWQDEVFRSGLEQNYNLSMSGGSDATQYFVSGSVSDIRGTLINSEHRDYSLQANLNSGVGDALDFQLNFSGTRKYRNNGGSQEGGYIGDNPIASALSWAPNLKPYQKDGTYTVAPTYGTNATNPLHMSYDDVRRSWISEVLAASRADLQLLEDLSLTVNGSARSRSNSYESFTAPEPGAGFASAQSGGGSWFYLDWQHSERLTYDNAFNDNHELEVSAIFEQQRRTVRRNDFSNSDFPSLSLRYYSTSLGANPGADNSYTEWSLMSYVGRANYELMGRYLFTGTVRVDGSSRFTEGNRYGTFPSAAVAWRLSEEPFLQPVDWLDNLKLRASWGLTGTQAINAYETLQSLSTDDQLTFDGSTELTGIGPSAPANPNLTWEITEQVNFGLEGAFLDERLSFTADLYQKNTSDLLLGVSVPSYQGYDSITQNIGEVRNRGVEFSVSAVPVLGDDFEWSARFNISANRGKAVDIGDNDFLYTGDKESRDIAPRYIVKEGQQFPFFYGPIYEGYWTMDEAEEAARYDQKPGDARYRDLNGDGNIDADDATTIGDPNPDFQFGLSTSLRYKGFTLDLLVHGVQGHQIMNMGRYALIGGGGGVKMGTGQINADRWTPDNQDAALPAFSSTSVIIPYSTLLREDGSYIRLRNVSLGYELPSSLLNGTFVRNAEVYLSAQDPLTITGYKGYDPEAPLRGSDVQGGLDFGTYPNTRTFTLGLKTTF